MQARKLTRGRFLRRGAASAAVVGVGFGAAPSAGAATPDNEIIIGDFVKARDKRTAVVSDDSGKQFLVQLDSPAFVAHGVDGVVDTVEAFVSGERVMARGTRSSRGMVAIEFQSVYTSATGELVTANGGLSLRTPTGAVRVPAEIATRDKVAVDASAKRWDATVWTHPATGDMIAVELDVADA
jgi:hypothetical protein